MRNYAKRWSLAAEASQNLENAATAPTYWIAAVSAAEEFSLKVHKVREVLNKKAGVSSRFSVYSFTLAYLLFTRSFPHVQQPCGAE